MPRPSPLSAQLVDDHALIREGLRRALERTGRFVVVGESGTLDEARARIRRRPPDVVIVDVKLPDGDGLDLVRELVADYPSMAVVVVTMYGGDEQLLAAMEAGASAFASKGRACQSTLSMGQLCRPSPNRASSTADGLEHALSRQPAQQEADADPA
jgi:DNA-binding NarL/FixJ family response regulator